MASPSTSSGPLAGHQSLDAPRVKVVEPSESALNWKSLSANHFRNTCWLPRTLQIAIQTSSGEISSISECEFAQNTSKSSVDLWLGTNLTAYFCSKRDDSGIGIQRSPLQGGWLVVRVVVA
ncbi:hypothetical protein Slin15195_G006600 [Septoria linicola]|uniref:Uncharacterized protein n=1 Tax=Septoria linicola TaxID=215465 RepID=A0A9Q9ED32_9PEZI|nr:hypothetical protein Slin15195_G006600 [Septoria linicola]